MSKFTRLMVTSSFAAGFLALSMGVAPAASPAAAVTTNWSHAELAKSQLTEVRKKRRWGRRYGKRRYARRGYYRPYRYGYYRPRPQIGVWGPGFGVYIGPRYRYRYW